jgi:hypothetical protein
MLAEIALESAGAARNYMLALMHLPERDVWELPRDSTRWTVQNERTFRGFRRIGVGRDDGRSAGEQMADLVIRD